MVLDLCIFLSWFRQNIFILFFYWKKHCIEDSYSWKQWFEVKCILIMDFYITNMHIFASQDFNWWTEILILMASIGEQIM